PPAIRRALEARDRGCRFPGCGLRFTDAHHVRHWADGGETKLENLILLCHHHHRLVHEAGWTVKWWEPGHPAFTDPRGQTHVNHRRPVSSLASDPVEGLIAQTRTRGAEPDALTAGARWNRLGDIPGGVYFRALEALGGG
ncbi:MAG: HNH endonuclease, partial [marine benthic group bacterium]|nr:HNH endonuclease [Gemmatimonadota bacterium]